MCQVAFTLLMLIKWMRPALFFFIDFFAMTDAKHNNVVARHVEDHAIITDTEPVAAEFCVGQRFGVL